MQSELASLCPNALADIVLPSRYTPENCSCRSAAHSTYAMIFHASFMMRQSACAEQACLNCSDKRSPAYFNIIPPRLLRLKKLQEYNAGRDTGYRINTKYTSILPSPVHLTLYTSTNTSVPLKSRLHPSQELFTYHMHLKWHKTDSFLPPHLTLESSS